MGVFHPDLVGIQVRALQRLGAEHALVVYGRDGMDEVSLGAATMVGEFKDGGITRVRDPPRGLRPDDGEQPRAQGRDAGAEQGHAAVACSTTSPGRRATSWSSTPVSALYAAERRRIDRRWCRDSPATRWLGQGAGKDASVRCASQGNCQDDRHPRYASSRRSARRVAAADARSRPCVAAARWRARSADARFRRCAAREDRRRPSRA